MSLTSTSTLSKPFRSPMRVEVKKPPQPQTHNDPQQDNPSNDNSTDENDGPNGHESDLFPAATLPQRTSSSPIRNMRPNPPLFTSSPTRPSSYFSSSATKLNPRDPEYLTLQKQHTALLNEVSALRRTIDITQQALKIESSSSTTQLEALILKWRTVSRDAAEELFRSAKDRVNRMGGVGAWRDKTRKRDEAWGTGNEAGSGGWGMEEEIDEDDLSQEQKEQLDSYREEIERERTRYAEVKTGEEEEPKPPEKDDESFTMDMMLKQLNVELSLIGYDVETQRWISD